MFKKLVPVAATNMTNAIMENMDLNDIDLTKCCLKNAKIQNCDLSSCFVLPEQIRDAQHDLSNCKFIGLDWSGNSGYDLSDFTLENCDFSDAILQTSSFANANLKGIGGRFEIFGSFCVF